MTAIATIISLLPILLVEYQEVKLIAELNQFFHFDHNIFLVDSSVDMNQFIRGQECIPRSVYVYDTVRNNFTGLDRLKNIQSKNTFVVVIDKDASQLNLLERIKKIQRLQTNMKFGIFLTNFVSNGELKALFHIFKDHLIVNIFAVTHANADNIQGRSSERLLNIFTFHPFGTFEVTNVTGVGSYDRYFSSLYSNFQQHQLRIKHQFYLHSDEELWLTVFRLMNASFVVDKKQIDITPQQKAIDGSPATYMYPLSKSAQIIIVPEAEPYSDFSAYLLAITSDLVLAYSSITIVAVILMLCVIRYKKEKKTQFFQSVIDVSNLLLNDNGNINYQRLSLIEIFIIVPLTFVGLIIVNGILSNLQSHLTRPMLQPQINTIEDIYRSPFPIHTVGDKWQEALDKELSNLTTHEDWIDKIIALDPKQFFGELDMFNTTKSFLVDIVTMKIRSEARKRLNIRGFHNPQIQMFNYLGASYAYKQFLFFDRLNEIIHRINSAGLYDLWVRKAYYEIENNIVKKNVERLKIQRESVAENFEFPMIIVYGWLLSATVFTIEIIWNK